MSQQIRLIDVAKYYKGESHQDEALQYLQGQISPAALEQFTAIWRKPPAPPTHLISVAQLAQIARRAESHVQPFWEVFVQNAAEYEIKSPLEAAHFWAQALHETNALRWLTELGNTNYFRKYDGRRDLGNTQPGDGPRFRGRGIFQYTGRANYTELSKALKIDFVGNPELLTQSPHHVTSALHYWRSRDLGRWARADDLRQVTRRINGGFNGLSDRQNYLTRAKQVLGL